MAAEFVEDNDIQEIDIKLGTDFSESKSHTLILS
jgi:hypothetical protein